MFIRVFLCFLVTSASFSVFAETPQQQAIYNQFTESLNKKQPENAYRYALDYIQLGDGDMLNRVNSFLGLCSMGELGCTQKKVNFQKAVQYLEDAQRLKADDQNIAYWLYLAYDKANLNDKAFDALNTAAKLGKDNAMIRLAQMFEVGMPPATFDPVQAKNWLQRWLSLSNHDANLVAKVNENIGRLDVKIAKIKNASNHIDIADLEQQGHAGNRIAINKLITIYVNGNDQQKPDVKKAKFWADVSAAYSPRATTYNFIELAQDYQTADGTSKNLILARQWYKKTGEQNNRAKLALAQMDKDSGDNSSAQRLFKEICDNDKSIQYACQQTSYFYAVQNDYDQSLAYAKRSGDSDFVKLVVEAKSASTSIPSAAYTVQYVTDWNNSEHMRVYALTCSNGRNMGKFVNEFSGNSYNPFWSHSGTNPFRTFDEAARYECSH